MKPVGEQDALVEHVRLHEHRRAADMRWRGTLQSRTNMIARLSGSRNVTHFGARFLRNTFLEVAILCEFAVV
jgi:hypothetical protein